MYTYLKDDAYYDELYDKLTIDQCLEWENRECVKENPKLKGDEKKKEEIKRKFARDAVIPTILFFMKADRASKKSDAIQKWKIRDIEKDEKLANAIEPEHARCLGCSSHLKKCVSRDLMSNAQNIEEVLFMFECDKCGKRRAYWENGKEWEYEPTCVKCKAEVRKESIRKDNTIVTKYTCLQCGHIETDIFDLNKNKEELIGTKFEANRKKYCISEADGSRIMADVEGMRRFVGEMKEREENKDLYDEVAKIKRLTILELQTLLNPVLEKAGYVKLEFEKPDIQKDVILGFSVQDSKSGRLDRSSVYDLERLLRKALSDTNWRVMGDGVNYRLGYLQGRFKGIEGEENLLELVKRNMKKAERSPTHLK